MDPSDGLHVHDHLQAPLCLDPCLPLVQGVFGGFERWGEAREFQQQIMGNLLGAPRTARPNHDPPPAYHASIARHACIAHGMLLYTALAERRARARRATRTDATLACGRCRRLECHMVLHKLGQTTRHSQV